MSQTPRTDLQVQVAKSQGHDGYVHASFARVQEGEWLDMQTERDQARQHAEDEIVAHNGTKSRLAEWEAAFETTNVAQAKAEHLAVLEKRKNLLDRVNFLANLAHEQELENAKLKRENEALRATD